MRQVRFRTSTTVNSGGNLLVIFPPASLAAFDASSTASPLCIVKNNNYNPAGGNVTLAWTDANSFEAVPVGTSGINLTNSHFELAQISSSKIKVTLTGVSNLNRQGKIYIGESLATDTRQGIVGSSFQNARLMSDYYTTTNIMKLKHSREIEIATMDSSSSIDINYIPNTGYADHFAVEPTTRSTETTISGGNDGFIHQLVQVVGASTTTVVQLDFTVTLELRPRIDYLNNYPTSPVDCFLNPDPLLRRLGNITEAKIRVNNSDKLKLLNILSSKGFRQAL